MDNYYAILGVSPGADAEQIRRAFRERIKLCHPDKATGPQSAETARRLIEAYNHLKDLSLSNEVKIEYTSEGKVIYTAAGKTTSFYTTHGHNHYRSYNRESHKSAEDIFKDTIGRKAAEYISRFRQGSPDAPYRSVITEWDKKPEAAPKPDLLAGASEDAKRAFLAAEDMLREVAAKYKRQSNRPRRQWARDYIRDLNIVLIRFRTVATQHPSIYRGAMERLRQIQDLSMEIRQYLS